MLTESFHKLFRDLIGSHAFDVSSLEAVDDHAVSEQGDRRRRWPYLRHPTASPLRRLSINPRENGGQVIWDDCSLESLGNPRSGVAGGTSTNRIYDNKRRSSPVKSGINVCNGSKRRDTTLRKFLPHRSNCFWVVQRLHTIFPFLCRYNLSVAGAKNDARARSVELLSATSSEGSNFLWARRSAFICCFSLCAISFCLFRNVESEINRPSKDANCSSTGFARLACGAAVITTGISSASSTRTYTFRSGPRFVHNESASGHVPAIQISHRALRVQVVGHFHEGEASGTARLAVRHHRDTRYFPVLLKCDSHVAFTRVEIQVANKNTFHSSLVLLAICRPQMRSGQIGPLPAIR